MKQVIQAFKASGSWVKSPPGLGDFVRGACHLFERLDGTGAQLKVDISQTQFNELIRFDPAVFQAGDPAKIAQAEEFFVEHDVLQQRLDAFLASAEDAFYLCTNLGAWDRPALPEKTRAFIRPFYGFNERVTEPCAAILQGKAYEVLSIRCGDQFYGNKSGSVESELKNRLDRLIDTRIRPRARHPLVIMSDCFELKCELARQHGFIMFPHVSQHGAHGNTLPVAMDLNVLKGSKFNHHINAWQPWWSGFSHYTSIIFQIPSANYRAPAFEEEAVDASGALTVTATSPSPRSFPRRVRSAVRRFFS